MFNLADFYKKLVKPKLTPDPGSDARPGCSNCMHWQGLTQLEKGKKCTSLTCNSDPCITNCACNDRYQDDGWVCEDTWPSPACQKKI